MSVISYFPTRVTL